MLNRRTLLRTLSLAGFASRLPGSIVSEDFTLRNSVGITVRPTGDLAKPVLSVTLPDEAPHAVLIEFPEHAWGKPQGANSPQWFYKLHSGDPAQSQIHTEWLKNGNALRYTMPLAAGVTLRGEVKLEEDGIAIRYEISNPTETSFGEIQAPTCIKLYRPFTDVFLERTYVHHSNGLDLLASETPERLVMNAEEWLPCRYIVRCTSPPVSAEQRIEKSKDGVVGYRKLRLADAAFIATASVPSGWVAATHTKMDCPSIWTNPARTCHHTDPSGVLPTKSIGSLALKLYLLRGTPETAWAAVSKQ